MGRSDSPQGKSCEAAQKSIGISQGRGENRVSKQAVGPDGSKEGGFDLLFSEVNSPKSLSPGDPIGESQCSADVVVGGDW